MKYVSIALMIGIGLSACRAAPQQSSQHDGTATDKYSGASEVIAPSPTESTMTGPSQNDSSVSNPTNALMLSDEDVDFVIRASNGLSFMLETSRVALEKRISPGYRLFAQRANGEYSSAAQRLADIVRSKGGTVVIGMTRDQYNALDDLRKLDGTDFERRFRALQVNAHDDSLKLFERAAEVQEDLDLRVFAKDVAAVVHQNRLSLDRHAQ